MRRSWIKYVLSAIAFATLFQNFMLYILLYRQQSTNKARTVFLCGPQDRLQTVQTVSEKVGFSPSNDMETADLVWGLECSWNYIFSKMKNMGSHQRLNKIPGFNVIVQKAKLSTRGYPFMPKSFHVPKDSQALKSYMKANPKKLFLTKHPNHHSVSLVNALDLGQWEGYDLLIQELLHPPYLVAGHKFDLTMYVLVTSVNPLRVYTNKKMMLRFCTKLYKEFEVNPYSSPLDSYVVHDHHFSHAEWIPELRNFTSLQFAHHEALAAYIRSRGGDPDALYERMKQMVLEVILDSLHGLRKASKEFPNAGNSSFFQLSRWDFMVGQDLQPFLIEANGSPHMSSHNDKNIIRCSRYLFDAFHLLDLGSLGGDALARERDFVTTVELMIGSEPCQTCFNACHLRRCRLCFQCISSHMLNTLSTAYIENQNKGTYERLFPLTRAREHWSKVGQHNKHLTESDVQLQDWFNGMCKQDQDFC
ncbi:probable tubulin polyglutamylase ttll-15 isoform X1 [Tigriopus californicus]|nr:probable tubulin polyglutamylase ttll-15 isoform X1 [Tigriopus californicus]